MKKITYLLIYVALFCGAFIGMEWLQSYLTHTRDYNFEELSQYPDFVGVLTIDGVLSEPVMRSDDNAFYLTHSFNGETNVGGCAFIDSLYDETSDNMVIYGHNNHNKTVFSDLVKYMDSDFASAHRKITFRGKNGTDTYELVFVYNYNTNDSNSPYMPEYPKDYLSRFSYCPVYFQEGDISGDIITLSTCEESVYGQAGRLLLVGVKR